MRVCLCVFYNGAPGSGPGLLLCHTRLPHTHSHTPGGWLRCVHASSELFCFLHITENVEITAWSRIRSPAAGSPPPHPPVPIANGQSIRAAELLPPCLLKASDACVDDSRNQVSHPLPPPVPSHHICEVSRFCTCHKTSLSTGDTRSPAVRLHSVNICCWRTEIVVKENCVHT